MRKKSVRSILLCMIVILALGCAIILLIITEQPFKNDLRRTEKVNKEDEAVYVFEQEAGALQKLKLEPADDESFIVYSKNAEAAKRGEYLLEGMETFEQRSAQFHVVQRFRETGEFGSIWVGSA